MGESGEVFSWEVGMASAEVVERFETGPLRDGSGLQWPIWEYGDGAQVETGYSTEAELLCG